MFVWQTWIAYRHVSSPGRGSALRPVVLMLLAMASAPARASEPGDASASPPPAQSPPVTWDARARELMNAGKLDAADALLDTRLKAEPKDVQAMFLKGMIALARNNYPAAILHFRQALEREPNATRIRLELARTLFLAKKDEDADYQFKLAIAQHPPEAVVQNIARFREAIRARRAWRFNVNFGIAADSNINSATDKERVDIFGLPFQLDPSARARSGTGIIASGDASVRLLRNRKVPIYLGTYGRMVRYPDHSFDDIYVGGEAGPEFRLWGGRLRIAVSGFQRWYGGDPLVTSVGSRLNYDKVIGGRWSLEAFLTARHNTYARRSDIDGWDIEASVSTNRALSASTLGFTYGSIQRTFTHDPGQSSWSARLGGGVLKEVGWGLRPQIAFEVGRQVNDAPLAFFSQARRDWRLQATASIYKRDWNVVGFAPSLRVTYTRNFSTISLYDQKRLRVDFGIAKAF